MANQQIVTHKYPKQSTRLDEGAKRVPLYLSSALRRACQRGAQEAGSRTWSKSLAGSSYESTSVGSALPRHSWFTSVMVASSQSTSDSSNGPADYCLACVRSDCQCPGYLGEAATEMSIARCMRWYVHMVGGAYAPHFLLRAFPSHA